MTFAPVAVIVAALAASSAQQPTASTPARDTRAPQTDETVAVVKGARLTVENFAGEVIVKSWDRDSLRVIARHSRTAKVNIRTAANGVSVRADAQRGSVDYEITAPSWMPIRVQGTYNFVSVEGVQSEIDVETTRGDVVVKGGTGTVTAKSIQGQVIVEGARGRINANSVNENIRITGASGEINAETTNGHITMLQIKSASVEVATVNGNVTFEGAPVDSGRYRFTTHNGNIVVTVPETSNVAFVVRTYQGSFASAITLNGPARSEVRNGRRTTYTLGSGSAEMEMESFGGSIRIRAPGGAPAVKKKEKDPEAVFDSANQVCGTEHLESV